MTPCRLCLVLGVRGGVLSSAELTEMASGSDTVWTLEGSCAALGEESLMGLRDLENLVKLGDLSLGLGS